MLFFSLLNFRVFRSTDQIVFKYAILGGLKIQRFSENFAGHQD